MYVPKRFNRFALLGIALMGFAACFSQSKTSIGLNLTGEHTSSSDIVTGFGGVLERQFSKHHGLETGLYYRSFILHYQVYVDGALFGSHSIKEQFVSVPVLYKFYSSILNVSAGPAFDIYTGWKLKRDGGAYSVTGFSEKNKIQFGVLAKVSKTFTLAKKFFIEPELRYNSVIRQQRSYYGIGVAAKYSLTK